MDRRISTHTVPTNCNTQRKATDKFLHISTHTVPTNSNSADYKPWIQARISTHITPTNCNRNQVEATIKNVFQPLNSETLSPDVLYSQFFLIYSPQLKQGDSAVINTCCPKDSLTVSPAVKGKCPYPHYFYKASLIRSPSNNIFLAAFTSRS